jgi:hypothetical protein
VSKDVAIHLPNQFACTTRTVVVDGPAHDLRGFAQSGLPTELTRQLVVGRFLLSTAVVRSTVTADDEIHFAETLLKVPVEIAGQRRLFPVATWVTHEYSLIRGYLLGFNKFFAPGPSDLTGAHLDTAEMELDLRSCVVGPQINDSALPTEQALSLLLWTDYSVGDAHSQGFRTPDFTDYQRASLTSLSTDGLVARAFDEPLRITQAYQMIDTFTMTGTTPLPVESAVGAHV